MSRPRSILCCLALVIGAVTAVGLTADEPTADAVAFKAIRIDRPGPLGPITVFGDSVMLGSGLFSPTLPDHLAARGWGPIRYAAGGGFNTGTPARAPLAGQATWTIQQWRTEGWDPEHLIINLGPNDYGFCDGSSACMRGQMEHLLDTIGPGHQVWWPMMTIQPERAFLQHVWNSTLQQLANERPDLTTWNWPGEMATGPYPSSDGIHLSPSGYRERSARMAKIATAWLGEGGPSGRPPVELPDPTAEPSAYISTVNDRLIDTRNEAPGRRPSGSVTRVELGDRVPEGTTAAAVYVTAVRPGQNGHLSVAPCGVPATTSAVNFAAGVTRGAPTITALGDDRSLCVTNVGETDINVDLQGAFHPTDPTGLGFDPVPVPTRLADTRKTALTSRLVLDAPDGADAVAVNITAVQSLSPGHAMAGPCDAPPSRSSLNYRPGPPIAASAIVEVGDDGTFCISTHTPTHLVVDLTGTFSAGGTLRFVPVTPTRMLNTRDGTGGWGLLHGSGQIVRTRVAPASAEAVTGTITIVRPLWSAFLTGYGCLGDPPTSSVNAGNDTVAANSITTGVDDGSVCIDASAGTHTLFDTTGWWVE